MRSRRSHTPAMEEQWAHSAPNRMTISLLFFGSICCCYGDCLLPFAEQVIVSQCLVELPILRCLCIFCTYKCIFMPGMLLFPSRRINYLRIKYIYVSETDLYLACVCVAVANALTRARAHLTYCISIFRLRHRRCCSFCFYFGGVMW